LALFQARNGVFCRGRGKSERGCRGVYGPTCGRKLNKLNVAQNILKGAGRWGRGLQSNKVTGAAAVKRRLGIKEENQTLSGGGTTR